MIIDNGKKDKMNGKKIVTRICDDCGQKKDVCLSQIKIYRGKRGDDKDYCHKCSYKYRKIDYPNGEKAFNWKGGRVISSTGYYRVLDSDHKYEYEHKRILSIHLGRKLSSEEKVHHVDLNKKNNIIKNLFLCKNKTDHWACHQSMEECAFLLFSKKIWFNRKTKLYMCKYIDSSFNNFNDIDIKDILSFKTFKERRRAGGKYYLSPTNKKNGRLIHVLIAQRMYKRNLMANETVHHINGNTLDNDPNNLCLMTRSEHKLCHYSLQDCIAKLFIDGLVGFDNGKYFLK